MMQTAKRCLDSDNKTYQLILNFSNILSAYLSPLWNQSIVKNGGKFKFSKKPPQMKMWLHKMLILSSLLSGKNNKMIIILFWINWMKQLK